jgi:hypothetical protein
MPISDLSEVQEMSEHKAAASRTLIPPPQFVARFFLCQPKILYGQHHDLDVA